MGYCSDRQGEMVDCEGEPALADVWQRLLCFEYLPSGSADPSHGPEWRKAYQITGGMCDGLYYLHIVHLVQELTNILLDYNVMLKIVDLNLSRCYHEKQNRVITLSLIGTTGYLAPEFYAGGQMSFKSDIYSLGVIIIEILTREKGYTLPWW